VGPSKYDAEFGFWRERYESSGGDLRKDDYYRDLTARIGGTEWDLSFRDMVVVDIGCGPRGSLCWIRGAKLRVGIDPLADAYRSLGIGRQPMHYVGACGEALPLADAVADVVITINALDHVDDVARVLSEIRRVLKPGGAFIGSIGLRETATTTEPCAITREMVHAHLLAGWKVHREHVFPECHVPDDAYRYADTSAPPGYQPEMWVMWCRATRPA
jgi:SAM-dependent methyltransferase